MVFGPVVGPTRPGPHGPAAVERKWSHVWLSQGFEREKYLNFNKSTKLGRICFTRHKCKPKNLELRHSWHSVWQTVTELDENPSDEVRQLHTRLHSEVDSSSWKWSDCVSEDDTAVWRQRNIRSRCCIFDYFCREEAHTEKRIGPETEPCGTPQDRQAGERKGFLAAKQWNYFYFPLWETK